VVIAFWRHRHDLPADPFDALVCLQDAGRNRPLALGKGEVSPRLAFGGGGVSGVARLAPGIPNYSGRAD
jgi:hypothetical protein